MGSVFKQIWQWISRFSNFAKVFITLVTVCGIALGGIRAYNNSVIRKHDRAIQDQSMGSKLDKVLVKLDSLEIGQYQLKGVVRNNTEKLDHVIDAQRIQKGIMTREFAKTMTPEQVLQMMNDFDSKKNEGSSYMIPPTSNPYLIPYILTYR